MNFEDFIYISVRIYIKKSHIWYHNIGIGRYSSKFKLFTRLKTQRWGCDCCDSISELLLIHILGVWLLWRTNSGAPTQQEFTSDFDRIRNLVSVFRYPSTWNSAIWVCVGKYTLPISPHHQSTIKLNRRVEQGTNKKNEGLLSIPYLVKIYLHYNENRKYKKF